MASVPEPPRCTKSGVDNIKNTSWTPKSGLDIEWHYTYYTAVLQPFMVSQQIVGRRAGAGAGLQRPREVAELHHVPRGLEVGHVLQHLRGSWLGEPLPEQGPESPSTSNVSLHRPRVGNRERSPATVIH